MNKKTTTQENSSRLAGSLPAHSSKDWYPASICLHRVRDDASPDPVNDPAHGIHAKFKMSITRSRCEAMLAAFDAEVAAWNQQHRADTVALITFDDGWKDVLVLEPAFRQCPNLLPVLFIGENHYGDAVRPLPMQRLYQHFSQPGAELPSGTTLADMRRRLKQLPEPEQQSILSAEGVAEMLNPDWLLAPDDLSALQAKGWVIASHGPRHEYLSRAENLPEMLHDTASKVIARGHTPWLAWPEGEWSPESAAAASAAGFTLQFGLQVVQDAHPAAMPPDMLMRDLWM